MKRRSPLRAAIDEDGRKLKWLAGTTGIDYQRLQRIMNQGYEPTLSEAARVSNALKRSLLNLFPSAELEAALALGPGDIPAAMLKQDVRTIRRQRG